MASLLSILAPLEGQIADAALVALDANRTTLLADANALGVKGIAAIAEVVTNALPEHGLGAIIKPFLAKAITDAEPQIIALLGGEEQALYAAAEAYIQAFAKAHGG